MERIEIDFVLMSLALKILWVSSCQKIKFFFFLILLMHYSIHRCTYFYFGAHEIQDLIGINISMRRSTRSASKAESQIKDEKVVKSKKSIKQTKSKAEEEQKDEPKPSKKVKKTQSRSTEKEPVKKEKAKKDEKDVELKKVTLSGKAPVDPHFTRHSQGTVVEHGGKIYAATLNQTNVAQNNNKFYILQIIQVSPREYYFFCRWGRVGVVGQTSEMLTTDLSIAIREYETKLRQKTKSGSYRIVQMNYQNDDEQEEEQAVGEKKQEQPEVESQLDKKVQDFIRLIFDMKMMSNHMKEIGYDAKKMPLGKLSRSSIEKGYIALNALLDEVKGKRRRDQLEQYSNDFYSYIPHDFGFIKMQHFLIDTEKKVRDKLEMLQSLEDIQVYTKILGEGKIHSDINEIDSNYLKLKTEIKPLDKDSRMYEMLLAYVKNTHASTHNNYSLDVLQIFQMDKEEDNLRYTKDIDNKQLLWHGSRLTNYVGIISQGLRIAPPEAPVTGYMFGKGVYFADMVSKSANYCCTSKANNIGLMLLCEVALGDMSEKFGADYYASNLPPGKSSTKGMGRTAPMEGNFVDDVWVPTGVGKPTGINHTALLYNEFIVYDVAQIKLKYLFKMKFNYK